MVELKVNIPLIKNENITGYSLNNFGKNNISSDISNVFDNNYESEKYNILGLTKLGKDFVLNNEIDYFIGNKVPSQENVYTITIESTNLINALNITFDTTYNRFPNLLKVIDKRGETIYRDNDSKYVLNNLQPNGDTKYSIQIKIDNWNSEYPLVIQGIYVGLDLKIDNNNLENLEFEHFQKASADLPSYGIISTGGNILFNDLDGEIQDYVEQFILTTDLTAEITLQNRLKPNIKKTLGYYKTRDLDYDINTHQCSISLQDDLEEWQDIKLDKHIFIKDENNPSLTSIDEIYKYLYSKTPKKYKMLSYDELDLSFQEFLSKTSCVRPFFEQSNLWDMWTIFCEVCSAYIYKTYDGRTVCKQIYY